MAFKPAFFAKKIRSPFKLGRHSAVFLQTDSLEFSLLCVTQKFFQSHKEKIIFELGIVSKFFETHLGLSI